VLDALKAFGLHLAQPLPSQQSDEPEIFYLWPEHERAYQVFCRCVTQWRWTGMDGTRTGLDYPAVEIVMREASGRRSGFRPADRALLWQEIRALEIGALKAWAADRKTKTQNRNTQ
jgi:hypothetical protein